MCVCVCVALLYCMYAQQLDKSALDDLENWLPQLIIDP